jgi:hypothetical protein
MNPRVFLQAIAKLGVGNERVDWANATNAHVHSAWKQLRQSPLHVAISHSRRLSLIEFNEPETKSDPRCALLTAPHTSAQAAHWLFQELGQEVRDRLGVSLVDPDESIRRSCFVEVRCSLEDANSAAAAADIPLQFTEERSAAEAWELQVQLGKVVGMDDPVWMAKAQAEIDAHLNRVWGFTKGE